MIVINDLFVLARETLHFHFVDYDEYNIRMYNEILYILY